MKRTVYGVVGGAALAAGLLAGPAQAAGPAIQHFTAPAVYTLSPADTGCTFDIAVNGVDNVVIQTFANKVVVHDDFSGTESANGVTLLSSEHATITDDLVTGTQTWVGQPLRVSLPNGGTVTLDAGKLVYNPDGSIAVQHGPHPFADGNVAEYCAAFTP